MKDPKKSLTAKEIKSQFKMILVQVLPFFGCLASYAQYRESTQISTAATDGQSILLNVEFFQTLRAPERMGVLLHELLHLALLHASPSRIGRRDRELWNIAADIVVNGIIAQSAEQYEQESGRQLRIELPKGAIRVQELENKTVEQVYEALLKQSQQQPTKGKDEDGDEGEDGDGEGGIPRLSPEQSDLLEPDAGQCEQNSPSMGAEEKRQAQEQLEEFWKNALNKATLINHQKGSLPLGIERETNAVAGTIDWQTRLSQFVVRTPNDFSGFDRRFIGEELYLDELRGESLFVYVAVDTSGSIGESELKVFAGELEGILKSYTHIRCLLYYADADIYGPYELTTHGQIPPAKGGGGTSFVPFFEEIESDNNQQSVAIYLTDGYGDFPKFSDIPTLWVVTPDGLDEKEFPFGEVITLLAHNR